MNTKDRDKRIEIPPGEDNLLDKIVRHLVMRTSYLHNPGLLSGKMGIAIFFYKYARHCRIRRYYWFAGELLDEIYDGMDTGISKDFGDGLAGICWGVELLVRGGYVNADADEVLGDMDQLILERDVRRINDTSLETGLEGLAHYVLARCSGKTRLPIDSRYIAELKHNMTNRECSQELAAKLDDLLTKGYAGYEFDLVDMIAARSNYDGKPFSKNTDLGISKNGLSGIALKLINESGR